MGAEELNSYHQCSNSKVFYPMSHFLSTGVPVSYTVCEQFEIKFQLLIAPSSSIEPTMTFFHAPCTSGWETDVPAELCFCLSLLAALGVISQCPHVPGQPYVLLRHPPK